MLDLSNNNGPVDFRRLFQAGQRRVYLKVTESASFVDRTYRPLRLHARGAGFKVGGYHFAHGRVSARTEAEFFLNQLGPLDRKHSLRPVLDLEFGTPSPSLGRWAAEWIARVKKETGVQPVLYSYGSFVESLGFSKPIAPLWLASYGRNDGREHPFLIPRPWKRIAAHQYSSRARVPGASGLVDISHIFDAKLIDIPRRWL